MVNVEFDFIKTAANLVVPRSSRKYIGLLQRRIRDWTPSRLADFLRHVFSTFH